MRTFSFTTLILVLAAAASPARAQTPIIEELLVTARTGSHISQHSDPATSISEFAVSELQDAGVRDLRGLVDALPMSAGAENNSDNLTQNFTVGTANVNLRGLGVASTLVLLDGRRQVLSAAQTDDGASFVDLAALVPMLAVERVEVLKDGASAIYGSEAVAGVVNFITRQGFEGAELQLDYRGRTGSGSQEDLRLDGVWGGAVGESGDFLLAGSYLERGSLVLVEVDWLRPATSGFGNPGSYSVPSLGRTVADPQCADYGGLLRQLANGGALCRFDYGPQVTATPDEERLQLWGRYRLRAGERTSLSAELGHAGNDISRDVSPSFPVLNTPTVPAYHPANIFGEEVLFQGRPYGFGQPPEINYYAHDTSRAALALRHEFVNGVGLDMSLVHAGNDAMLGPRDVVAENFQLALLGYGGDGCDAASMQPGTGACRFFNPFASHFNAAPGDALHNAPELRDFIIGDYAGDGDSRLTTFDASLDGDLPLAGGAWALGAQFRRQSIDFSYDPITRGDGFAFLIGNSNFAAEDEVAAIWGEVLLPLNSRLEASLALRHEDYGDGVGATTDPKAGFLYRVSETLALRASWSTSFRAPSPFQTQGVQTNFTNIIDYDGSTTFAGRRTLGDPRLRPESAEARNLGLSWEASANWAWDVDYWRYEFTDVLRKDNAQAIVNANPFDPRIERTSAGTVSIVNVAYINADSIETSGIDASLRGELDTRFGPLSLWAEATRLLEYEVTNAGVLVDALGKLNRANVGAPNQRLKAAAGLSWLLDSVLASALLRHAGKYEDDAGGGIGSFTTLDINARWQLDGAFGPGADAWIQLGLINLFDRNPPYVAVAGSYDPRSADPRGRRAFAAMGFRF